MNKNIKTILTTAALALMTGYVTAGTWVNGCYIDGPICTVCDGYKVVAHTYGTTICAHCEGTGIEPPDEPVIVENVIVDTWHPAPPPPPRYHHRPAYHHPNPPRHGGGVRHNARPPARPAARPAPRPAARPAARPTAHNRGGGRGGRR